VIRKQYLKCVDSLNPKRILKPKEFFNKNLEKRNKKSFQAVRLKFFWGEMDFLGLNEEWRGLQREEES
jgi:hypothetical protein